jgi:acyl carrier protein
MLGAMSDKLKNIAAQVFQVDANSIELAMTPEDIEKWDSLNHLRLITAVETEFNVRLSMSQIQGIECLGDLHSFVEKAV